MLVFDAADWPPYIFIAAGSYYFDDRVLTNCLDFLPMGTVKPTQGSAKKKSISV